MIANILPTTVSSAVAYGDREGDAHLLFPDEERLVARAVEARRRSFITGRACARRALAGLGIDPVAIRADPRGAPLWPANVVGSITHCEGYRASAVAWRHRVVCLGIDAEPHDSLPTGVLSSIALRGERIALGQLAAFDSRISWDRLLFSAKETIYKAWYPLTGRWLGFMDAQVTFDALGGVFDARLLVPGPVVAGRLLRGFRGRWLVDDNLIVTAIAGRSLTAPRPPMHGGNRSGRGLCLGEELAHVRGERGWLVLGD